MTRVVGAMALTVGFATLASAQALFQLVLTPSTISFPDANPTTIPSILASSQVDVFVKTASLSGSDVNYSWSVSALSSGDLQSGPDTIAITSVTWTSLGVSPCASCVCFAGTASSVAGQLMLSGTGEASVTCRKTFTLANSWSYNPGSYSQVMSVTASSP